MKLFNLYNNKLFLKFLILMLGKKVRHTSHNGYFLVILEYINDILV